MIFKALDEIYGIKITYFNKKQIIYSKFYE